MQNDIFRGYGVEVRLTNPETFLVVKETLTRIGIASKKSNALFQSCHILHKRGRYVIIHFKELFGLDGHSITFTEEDMARRNTIAKLLMDWGLVEIIDEMPTVFAPMSVIKVVPFKEKGQYTLIPKYQIGKKPFSVNPNDEDDTEKPIDFDSI